MEQPIYKIPDCCTECIYLDVIFDSAQDKCELLNKIVPRKILRKERLPDCPLVKRNALYLQIPPVEKVKALVEELHEASIEYCFGNGEAAREAEIDIKKIKCEIARQIDIYGKILLNNYGRKDILNESNNSNQEAEQQ